MTVTLGVREEALSAFILGTRWEDLPADVREWALMCLDGQRRLGAVRITGDVHADRRIRGADLLPGDQATLLACGRSASDAGGGLRQRRRGERLRHRRLRPVHLGPPRRPGAPGRPGHGREARGRRPRGPRRHRGRLRGHVPRRSHLARHPHAEYRACGTWGSIGCAAIGANLLRLSPRRPATRSASPSTTRRRCPCWTPSSSPPWSSTASASARSTGLLSRRARGARLHGHAQPARARGVRRVGGRPRRALHPAARHELEGVLVLHVGARAAARCGPSQGQARLRRGRRPRIVIETYPEALQLHVVHPQTYGRSAIQHRLAGRGAARGWRGGDGAGRRRASRRPRAQRPGGQDRVRGVRGVPASLRGVGSGRPDSQDAAGVTIELSDGRVLESGLVEHPVYEKEAADWDRARMETKVRWLLRHLVTPRGPGRTRGDALVVRQARRRERVHGRGRRRCCAAESCGGRGGYRAAAAAMTPEELLRVHEAGLRVLGSTGVVFESDDVVRRFRAAGFASDGARVFMTEDQVTRGARYRAALVRARDPRASGGPWCSAAAARWWPARPGPRSSRRDGELRLPGMADVTKYAKLCHQLEQRRHGRLRASTSPTWTTRRSTAEACTSASR